MNISQIAANHAADSTMTTAQRMTPPHMKLELEGLGLLIKSSAYGNLTHTVTA